MTHDELHAKAIMAVDVAANEGFIDIGDFSGVDEREEVRAWVDHAANALRKCEADIGTEHGRHEELHRQVRRAINDVDFDEDIVTRGDVLAWLDAAADALRLQRLGHRDHELLEFVQGERNTAIASVAALTQLRDRLSRELLEAIGEREAAALSSSPSESVLHGLRIMADAIHIDDNPRHPERNGMASIDGCYIGPPDDPAHLDVRAAKEWLEAQGMAAGFHWRAGNAVCQCDHLAGTHQSERARTANGEAPCGADGCGCTLGMEDDVRGCSAAR